MRTAYKLGRSYRVIAFFLLIPVSFTYLFSFDKKLRENVSELWNIAKKGKW